ELVRLMTSPEMQARPNVNPRFNVMLVKPADKVAVYEKMFLLDRKIETGLAKADFILSGDISALSQRAQGQASDYLLISVQLTNPENNETVWEDAYETKRLTKTGIVYQ
ncbi:MAG: penicillin-binding protein activator LpoB, partial [Spirochaetia bacterium]|nr:penicillin-binding protein activator LpoB [Spirochaetia bacterium]